MVNGNHFRADAQVIVCNPEKEKSLLKRADQLTNVVAVITSHDLEVPDYVKQLLPADKTIPVLNGEDDQKLSAWIAATFLQPAPLHALILTGGKSVRMGKDKALLAYHGKPQYQYLYQLLEDEGIVPFISCREEQRDFFEDHGCRTITDRILGVGPLGGIISAFMRYPDHAWLVLACDLPLLDTDVIRQLMRERRPGALATSYQSPFDRFPEPLIAIWEPSSYPRIMQLVAQGISCPRKVLINSPVHIIHATDPDKLANVNSPDDLEDVFPEMRE
ncbi:MAG: NTP transferase domain-containing protein [Flavobacteriales bacterium]|nr:NTP transferase domain-containing protein [Flavobacteriales bacterium]